MSEPRNRRQVAFVSAEEVARLAGVSRSAVSRAFTPGASISAETRRRVEAAAAQLGYHVNHLARGLMRHESGIVCLVVADIHTPYLSRLLDHLSRGLQEAGKAVMVLNAGRNTVNVEAALKQTLNYRADATIVLSGTPYRSIARQCLESGQRLILINRDDHLEQTVGISVDHAKAARTAAMLIRRGGYRRPALVSSGIGTPSLNARRDHFLEALRDTDLPTQRWEGGPTAYASGFQAGTELMNAATPPDAIFAVTDLLACGIMDAVRQTFNKRVPQEVGIIGFDNIEQAGWSSYDLTTFSQPVEAITAFTIGVVTQGSAELETLSQTFEAPLIWRNSLRAG